VTLRSRGVWTERRAEDGGSLMARRLGVRAGVLPLLLRGLPLSLDGVESIFDCASDGIAAAPSGVLVLKNCSGQCRFQFR
jgi:hypothetical protein